MYRGHSHELKLSTYTWYREPIVAVDSAVYPTATVNGYDTAIASGITLAESGVFPAITVFE